MRSKLLTGVVIAIFLLSMTATPQAETANFELKLIYPSDVLYYDSIGQAISQQLSKLLILIDRQGLNRPNYFEDLSTHDYDLALFSYADVSEEFPPLWSMYHPDSFTGEDIYRTADNITLTKLEIETPDELFDLLDQYRLASDEQTKQELAMQIQQVHNEDWLLDVPLVSTADIIASWPQFAGFSHEEGLINSLFLGANWTSNPEARVDQDRTTTELHYEIENFRQVRNPLFYQGRDGFLSLKPIFSSVFLKDGDNNLHPNLAHSFEYEEFDNGSSAWTLHLRDDVTWSDGEPLNASDVKFTYDMVSFNWIGATNNDDWDNLEDLQILNETSVRVQFNDTAITNQYDLSDQYIVPEHVLNKTITIEGEDYHPYDNFNPQNTQPWQEFEDDPITAGPFVYDKEQSRAEVVEVFTKSSSYWSPSIEDSPNGVFNLTSGQQHEAKYFDGFDDISIETLVYQVTGTQSVDPNTKVTTFTTGSRDIVEFDSLDPNSEIFEGQDFRIDVSGNTGGLVMIFNPDKSELQQYDMRKAITQAIDRDEITSLMGKGHLTQGTPVSKYFGDYYNTEVEITHDFDAARDSMQRMGYDVIEEEGDRDFQWPWEEEELPLPVMPFLLGFVTLVLLRVRYRKR